MMEAWKLQHLDLGLNGRKVSAYITVPSLSDGAEKRSNWSEISNRFSSWKNRAKGKAHISCLRHFSAFSGSWFSF